MSARLLLGAVSLVFGLLLPAANGASATQTSNPTPQPPATVKTAATPSYLEPEIVRITYVQGDVRLAPSDGKGAIGQRWVEAQPGVPIEQGYTVATGVGRAEIELEDNSVIYLADDSTLLFENLISFNGAPHTTVELVSGTATLDAHPLPGGGTLVVETPSTNWISIAYPQAAFLRLDSYVNGMVVTPQQVASTKNEGSGQQTSLRAGQSVTYTLTSTHTVDASETKPPDSWDQWVKSQVAGRQKDMQAALKASSLTAPVPGLIELYKTGTFSPCAPYGTCWQPNQSAAGHAQNSPQVSAGAQQTLQQGSPTSQSQWNQVSPGANPKQLVRPFSLSLEPCVTEEGYERWDPQTRKWIPIQQTITDDQYWDWETCRAGAWIRTTSNNGGNYVLVLSKRKHPRHHPPIRWVHVNNETGYVPRDPRDKPGHTPINLKYGLFVPGGKANQPVKLVDVSSSTHVRLLSQPPKNFAQISSGLIPAERPVIATHALPEDTAPVKSIAAAAGPKSVKAAITYDYKKNGFVTSGATPPKSVPKSGIVATLDYRGPRPSTWTVWSGLKVTNSSAANAILRARTGSSYGGAATVGRSGGNRSGRGQGSTRANSGGGGHANSGGGSSGGRGYSGGGGRSYGDGGGGGGYSGGGGGGSGGGMRGGGAGGSGGRR